MKKILIVNTVNFKLNGITSVILNYFFNMDRSCCTFDFLTINEIEDELKTRLEKAGARIFTIKRRKRPLKYIIEFYKLLKSNNYDVVHIHGQSANMAIELFLSKIAGVRKRIAHSHNTTVKRKFLHYLFYPLFKFSYTDGLACSNAAGQWLFHNSKFVILNNGISIEKFRYNAEIRKRIRKQLDIPEDAFVLGHIGLFNEQKNHTFLVDVFQNLRMNKKCFKLVLVGSGPLEMLIRKKVDNLGMNEDVIFVGNTLEVQDYYQCMDLFVFPSIFEGLGIVLIEAQANSLPCLVSEAIVSEAKCTNRVFTLNLDEGPAIWCDKILEIANENYSRTLAFDNDIRKKNFDILNEANKLRDIYFND